MRIGPLPFVKFLEIVICIVCLWLHYESRTGDFDTDTVSVVAFGGFLIVMAGCFAGHIMSTPINRRIDIVYCLLGCALFIAAGALNIEYFRGGSDTKYRRYGLAKASIAIIGGAVYLVDSLLTWRGDY